MKRSCFAVLLLAALLLSAAVSAETSGDFEYTVENGRATVTAYTGSDTAVTVPSALNGSPVTAVGENAFMGCTGITSVTLP